MKTGVKYEAEYQMMKQNTKRCHVKAPAKDSRDLTADFQSERADFGSEIYPQPLSGSHNRVHLHVHLYFPKLLSFVLLDITCSVTLFSVSRMTFLSVSTIFSLFTFSSQLLSKDTGFGMETLIF